METRCGDKVWRQGVGTMCWRQGVSAKHTLNPTLNPTLKLTLNRHAVLLHPLNLSLAAMMGRMGRMGRRGRRCGDKAQVRSTHLNPHLNSRLIGTLHLPAYSIFACICPFAAPLSRFSRFSRLKKHLPFAPIRVHWRFRFPAPLCLRERSPVAFDKGDKVTDKARDKVDNSPERARHTSPGQRPGERGENRQALKGRDIVQGNRFVYRMIGRAFSPRFPLPWFPRASP